MYWSGMLESQSFYLLLNWIGKDSVFKIQKRDGIKLIRLYDDRVLKLIEVYFIIIVKEFIIQLVVLAIKKKYFYFNGLKKKIKLLKNSF